MLDKLDLDQSINKKTFSRIAPILTERLYSLQKASWDANIPVIILFEGWDAAGKGTSIQRLTSSLDPRATSFIRSERHEPMRRNIPGSGGSG